MLNLTGERYIPEMEPGIIHYEHLHRYKFAEEFVKDKTVLDLACGEGYGSFLLAGSARKVVGVDISEETIERASFKYKKNNLEFIQGSMTSIPVAGEKIFDIIVCFEAVEHIKEHEQLLKEVKRLLKDEGIFIISTPNTYIYSQKPGYNVFLNPFHLKEVSYGEFKELLENNFKEVFIYGQKVNPTSNIFPISNSHNLSEVTEYSVEKTEKEFLFIDSDKKEAMYFVGLASNSPIFEIKSGSYLTDVSEFAFKQKDYDIKFLKNSLEEKDDKIINLQNSLEEKGENLRQIQETYVWRVYAKFWNLINKIVPVGTKRRIVARSLISVFKKNRISKAEFESFLSNPNSILEFPAVSQPKASIIIVVLNNAQLTFKCLKSIKKQTNLPYEIIIVDNNSDKETKIFLSRVKGAKIITNSENQGFAKACNQGAKIALGEYIVLLNNDTEVLENWLLELVQTAEKDKKCGAVGAKLLFNNEKLQESGCIIWKDGSTLGYGRNDDPLKQEYSYLREVDYCSGAGLLIRADIFKMLDGFDEKFSPVYYEEVDFCMSLKKAGFKIIYQPAAKVLHREGRSSLPEQVSEWTVKNRKKFIEKWSEELKNYYSFSQKNILLGRDKKSGLKILFIDDRIPAPFLGSGYPRTFSLLKILSETEHKITFFPLQNQEYVKFYTSCLQNMGIEVLYNGGGKKIDLEGFLKNRQNYYDAIWISRPHNFKEALPEIKAVCPDVKIIYDVESLFFEREIIKNYVNGICLPEKEKEKMIYEEIFLMEKADMAIAVSEQVREKIIKRGIKNAAVIGHPLTLSLAKKSFFQRRDILFAGSMADPESPNKDAIIYFAKEIFPEIRKKINTRLIIAGTNTDKFKDIKKLSSPSIVVKGFVKNLEELYENCRVFIVPTRYSAGIPSKLLEAMSHGIPSAVSFLTAEQLGLAHGREALVAKTPEEFAENVISLYTNEPLWTRVQKEGFYYIEKTCSQEKLKNELANLLRLLFSQQKF
mgnify:FL=1